MDNFAYANIEEREDFELINGQVYMMASPKATHVRINGNLHGIFDRYLDGKRCEPFSNFNVFFNEDDHFIPDEIIVCDPDIIEEDAVHGAPDLVVEILSKSTARKDRAEKFFAYEKYGVKEYWIITPETKSVERYLRKDDRLILDNVYSIYSDLEWNMLTESKKAAAKFEIKVSLYDDFVVQLKDIFKRVK